MKRRYKPGAWFAVPLDARTQAAGFITHMAGTRIFANFSRAGSEDAEPCARFLCSTHALDDLRWPLIAAPARVDLGLYSLPELGERGAFGRTWWRRALDPSTLQTLARTSADRGTVQALPPAQILTASDVEARLREVLLGVRRDPPSVVCELRAPFELRSLDVLAAGGTVQLSEPARAEDLAQLGDALALGAPAAQNVPIALRLHAMHGEPFDLRALLAWPSLGELLIDTANIVHADALRSLPQLQRLRLGAHVPGMTSVLPDLKNLRTLTTATPLAKLPASLSDLRLVATTVPAQTLASSTLARLSIAHGGAPDIVIPATLEHLELQDTRLQTLPDLSRALTLHTLVLRKIRELKDLRALHEAPSLSLVVIEEMPQLHVDDFKPLAGTTLRFDLALGNRTMTREVYRLLGSGHSRVRTRVVQ